MSIGPDNIKQDMEAILRAKAAIDRADSAHARLDGHAEILKRLEFQQQQSEQIQAETADTLVTILDKLGKLTDLLPDLIILAKDRRGKQWLVDHILAYGKTAGALTAVAGMVYGVARLAAGLPVW